VNARFHWRDRDRIREVEIDSRGEGRYHVSIDGSEMDVDATAVGPDRFELVTVGATRVVEITPVGDRRFVRLGSLDFVLDREARGKARSAGHSLGGLEAPMPGLVTRVMVAAGDQVKKGQALVALEAMKMEHLIRSPRAGRIRSVSAKAGEMVNGGVPLVELEAES
jgi:biotin carboxyl carrier protein